MIRNLMEKHPQAVIPYSCTARESGQYSGVHESVDDLLDICQAEHEFGIPLIEGPWLTDIDNLDEDTQDRIKKFWRQVKSNSDLFKKMVAFGSTMEKELCDPKDSRRLQALLSTGAHNFCIFGKADIKHVEEILKTTPQNNLQMIELSCAFLKKSANQHQGIVVFDAEHFFDGFSRDKNYALDVLKAALRGQADFLVLCDTNGGMTAWQIWQILNDSDLKKVLADCRWGVHLHNDCHQAEASAELAVRQGATMVQFTFNGLSERTTMVKATSFLPNLIFKTNHSVLGFLGSKDQVLRSLYDTAHKIALIHKVPIGEDEPYVGLRAFFHGAGSHQTGALRNPVLQEHIAPEWVGNVRHFPLSGLGGKNMVKRILNKYNLTCSKKEMEDLCKLLVDMDAQGYDLQRCEHTFFQRVLDYFCPNRTLPLTLQRVKVDIEMNRPKGKPLQTTEIQASICCQQLPVDGRGRSDQWRVGFSNIGPVDAACEVIDRIVAEIQGSEVADELKLQDYHVHKLNSNGSRGTDAQVFVAMVHKFRGHLIETGCVDGNSLAASINARVDAINYALTYCLSPGGYSA